MKCEMIARPETMYHALECTKRLINHHERELYKKVIKKVHYVNRVDVEFLKSRGHSVNEA